ncbi:HAD hydrolase-like protein [Paenibacillus spongiae]
MQPGSYLEVFSAIDRLGIAANNVWFIGDNASTDIRGGSAAGCRTCLMLT